MKVTGKLGRFAVLGKAVVAFFSRGDADQEIDRRYEEGYRRFPAHMDPDLEGWTDEGVFPPE